MRFFKELAAEPNFALIIIILPTHESITSGNDNNLKVCPVGAVSNTTTSYSFEVMTDKNTSKAAASSAPGEEDAISIWSDKKSKPIKLSEVELAF